MIIILSILVVLLFALIAFILNAASNKFAEIDRNIAILSQSRDSLKDNMRVLRDAHVELAKESGYQWIDTTTREYGYKKISSKTTKNKKNAHK